MSEGAVPGSGPALPTRAALPSVLVGIRAVVLIAILIGASRGHITDPVVARAERVATSPATPYRAFPVGTMPVETAIDGLLAGGGAGLGMGLIAIVAFLADLATAWGLRWGWGRRPSIVYLLIGLPLLSFLYLRFDLVSVALAVWAIAWIRNRGESLGGAALALATMAKLWPILLLPIVWLHPGRRRALGAFVAVVVVLGAWWYLTGGPKGPFQVLTFQGARGWDVQSTIGSLLWVAGRGIPVPEFDLLRVGDASLLARGILLAGLVACEVAIWRRPGRNDPAGGAALAAVIAPVVFAPQFPVQYAIWLLPWTALAFEGDHHDQRTAIVSAVAIGLTGVIAIAWADPSDVPGAWLKVVVLARNLAAIGVLVSWFASRRSADPADAAPAAAPVAA
jgi:Glycosyltransferase family 87